MRKFSVYVKNKDYLKLLFWYKDWILQRIYNEILLYYLQVFTDNFFEMSCVFSNET